MKHVRNFESFKQNKKQLENTYYLQKGKSSTKTIIELHLTNEGYSFETIKSLNENYSLVEIDKRIIDGVFEYLRTGKETSIELLTEELEVLGLKLPSLGDMYKGVKGVVDKGVEIGKTAVKSFTDFIKNIGNVIKGLFEKIKAFFRKVWEMFKPQVIAACKVVSKSVMSGKKEKMTSAVDKIASEQGQKEVDILSEDLAGAIAKLSSGNVGNMTPEAEQKLSDEAGEYKDAKDDPAIEQLMKDSYNYIERKNTVKKLFYSVKGYLLEGGSLNEMYDAIFEAEEKKEDIKEGDEVTYTNKEGKEVTKKVIRIEGDNAVFQSKDGGEFTKLLTDLKKGEDIGKKLVTGFVGEEPEKKGIFGWLVEAVGLVFSPLTKLKETMIKGGINGVLTLVSGMKRGLKNAFKFVVIGVVAGLVYHIVHGLMVLGEELGGEEAGAAGVTGGVAAGAKVAESLITEAEQAIPVADVSKPTKYTEFLKDAKTFALPAVGSILFAVLGHFFPIVKYILEAILITIGLFELVGALCKLDWVKSKNLKVCKVQHDVHHWVEGKLSGKAHH